MGLAGGGFLLNILMKKYLHPLLLIASLFLMPISFVAAQEATIHNRDTTTLTDSINLPASSFLKVMVNYVSHALSAGRDYGIDQYGINAAVEYNNKKGWYTGCSGSLLSANDPAYSVTTLYAGFVKGIGKYGWYDVSYSHSFFNPDSNKLLNNSLGASISVAKKWFTAGGKYNFLFGEEKGHELIVSSGLYFEKETGSFIDAITCNPGISAVFGTSNITFKRFTLEQFQKGTGETWQQYNARIASRRSTSNSSTSSNNEFGLMNWDIAVPVSFTIKNCRLTLSYNYAIPIALPNEATTMDAKGFFGVMISYVIK